MPVVEGNECSPQRKAGDEGSGPVDGVEHPGQRTAAPLRSVFFAEDAVRRVAASNQLAHGLLARLVGEGNRVEHLAPLVRDFELRAKEGPNDFG